MKHVEAERCVGCGYPSRGLRDRRCPECGGEKFDGGSSGRGRSAARVAAASTLGAVVANVLLGVLVWFSIRLDASGDGQSALAMLCPMGAFAITLVLVVASGVAVSVRSEEPQGLPLLDILIRVWSVVMLVAGAAVLAAAVAGR